MRSFLFLRHGETDWNVVHRMQGQIQDIPLNQTGHRQAAAAAALLVGHAFDLIVSSTLDRAATTARIIAEQKGLPLVLDKRLIERGYGVAEGLTYKELGATNLTAFFSHNPEGAETKAELTDRAFTATFDLISRHEKQRLLLVTHAAWLRALVYRLTGIDRSFPNATPFLAYEETEGWQIKPL